MVHKHEKEHDLMKNSFVYLLGAVASAALLSSTLGAKNSPRGGMHIPVVGYESFAGPPAGGTFDFEDGILKIRGLVADLKWELTMPYLGMDVPLVLIAHATINQDRAGPVLLLRMWARGEVLADGEVIGYFSTVDLPVPLGGTMYEGTLNTVGVIFEGPLKGCTFQWTSRSIGGIQGPNPPDYLAEIKGFLIVPDNLDIGEIEE